MFFIEKVSSPSSVPCMKCLRGPIQKGSDCILRLDHDTKLLRSVNHQNLVVNTHTIHTIHIRYIRFIKCIRQKLKSKNINITHIDNPIHHKGLESTEIFLKKTEEGLENLFHLAKNYELKRQIKIYNYFLVWKKLKPFANPIYSIVKKCTRFLLTRGLHHLFIFDLYKLTFLLCYKD